MRFLSTIPGRLDGKGRVSIPAPFRAVLEADQYPGLFVHQALELPALEAGGNRLLREIDGLIERFPAYSEARDLIATALLGGAETLKSDPEGRILLPERFKAYAGITTDVVFVGLGDKFRIWEPNRFSAHLAEAKASLRELRAELSGRRPSGSAGGGGSGNGEQET
jgi:MraZ protein